MSRKKLKKINEVDKLPNVFNKIPEDKQAWLTDYFGNTNDLVMEIGCGRGDYSIALAEKFPGKNFIGVDVKGARLWTGANTVLKLKLTNVAFLRASALELTDYFEAETVSEIWIPFPDPFPKKKGIKRRVTSPEFLQSYQAILKKSGIIHLKTDDPDFYEYSCEVADELNLKVHAKSQDIYNNGGLDSSVTEIRTKYEERHLLEGRIIKYLCFSF